MKPKTRFLKMYYKLPEAARTELILGYPEHPMTLRIMALEVKANTKLGKELLEKLGYVEEKE